MEDQTTMETTPIQPEPAVSFPDPRHTKPQGSFPKWIFAVIGLVVILAAGGFFLYQSSTSTSVNPTPSPFVSGIDTLPTPTETPMVTTKPTSTPAATPTSTQRTGVSVEVQNGTGTTGDAALAKSLIEKAGYTKLSTGNATSQTATSTSVQYSSDVPLAVVNEISQALSDSFGTVTPTSGLTGKMVVRVITGPKTPGSAVKATTTATSTPKATTTPKPSATATATATASATPTTKPSTTPTATP